MTRKQIGSIICLFLVWRIGLFVISYFAGKFLPYAPSFPYATTLLPSFGLPQWLYSFANFDGVHYLTIGKEGYGTTNFIQAFFPLYPYVLLHGLHQILPSLNLLLVGLLISNLSFVGFMVVSFDLIQKRFSSKVAWLFLIAVLVFPWSIFLASLYTESLFLFFMVLCFWFAAQKKWWAASLCTALLSATRIVGVLMIPALMVELWHDGERDWKKYALLLIGSLGLLAYMVFLKLTFNDPLYFLHVQSAFGAGRSNGFVIYPQVVWRSLKILLTSPHDLKYVTYLQEFLAGTVGFFAILIPYRKLPWGVTFFSLASVLVPSVSGSFLSMGRFLLPCMPLYVLMALIAHKYRKTGVLLYVISGIIMILNALLFLQGYWVA